MRHFVGLTVAIAALVAIVPSDAFGRGFGGAHGGGGFGGGGFHAGGGGFGGAAMSAFHPSGFGGGMPAGGFHPPGNMAGGMAGSRPGGFNQGGMAAAGGFHAGNGLEGFHDYGGIRPGGVVGGRPGEFAAGAGLASAPAMERAGGYDPVGIGGGMAVDRSNSNPEAGSQLDRFAAMSVGGAGTMADFASDHAEEPVKMDPATAHDFDLETKQFSDAIGHGDLPRYVSLPTDVGMSLTKADAVQHPVAAAHAVDPRAADKPAAQTLASARTTPVANRAEARTAQRWFDDHPVFTPAWLADHRNALAWVPFLSGYDDWDNAFWESVAWSTVGSWLSVPNETTPQTYDYGQDVVYNNGNVYINSQPVGNAAQFYSQAQTLADVAPAPAPEASTNPFSQKNSSVEWLPLGVYALMHSDKDKPGMVFQLAVNKQGILRGNYFSDAEAKTQPVSGSVDVKSQRVAWRVGDNNKIIVETSLDNLTKDESSALVHLGPDRQERYVLVRLKANNAEDKAQK